MSISLGQARAAYAAQTRLRSVHTLQAYLRAIDLLIAYLDDRQFEPRLPLKLQSRASELDVEALNANARSILHYFALWLAQKSYSRATIELRLAGVRHWLEFMQEKGWLPDFPLEQALNQAKNYLQNTPSSGPAPQPAAISYDMLDFLSYYQTQSPSRSLQNSPLQLERWELSRLRNHALIQVLAETGGQVSAILALNIADTLSDEIALTGKNEHTYAIVLKESMPALRDYLAKREAEDEAHPLFISHDSQYQGQRMSRVIAWRIIQRAAKAVNLPQLSPHDLRHWRAKQLIDQGFSAEELQKRLGHRSLNTIYAYYGEWLERP